MSSDLPVPHSAATVRTNHLLHVALYAIAVVGISVYLMHDWGLLWAASIFLFWGCFHFCFGKSISWLPKLVLYLLMAAWPLGYLYFGPVWFGGMSDYNPTDRSDVANEIRQLSLAMLNYESAYQHLPPAHKTDSNGRPMHSWRILVLPLLGNDHGDEIYRQYRMDQPWDSPHNLSVAGQLREPLFGDESDPTLATYKLVSGPGTLFGADTKSNYPRNSSEQISIVEDIGSPVLWTKPVDVTPGQLVAMYDAKNNPDGLYKKFGGRWSGTFTRKSWIGFLDGHVEKSQPLADSTQLLAFCFQDQNPSIDFYDLRGGNVPRVEKHGSDNFWVGGFIQLGLLALMLLPGVGKRWPDFASAFAVAFISSIATIVTLPILLTYVAVLLR